MSMSIANRPLERRSLPRERCVHFRFKLEEGYDFQAVALDASNGGAAFERHYEDSLSRAKSGYFETSAGMYEIPQLGNPLPISNAPTRLRFSYTSNPLSPSPLTDQEFGYVVQKKVGLRERHRQLQSINEGATRSVIHLYTSMLLYAAAPFINLHSLLGGGFFRVWGFGGIWLAFTAWFYCDRVFWKYGNHLFEQIFCMRQVFQMDKVAIGRCKLHNLYAILPSYGYSWDRRDSQVTPSDDPTRLAGKRVVGAAWFFKLVNFFPLMYLFLFLSMFLFPGKIMGADGGSLETYARVSLGFSFLPFVWLRFSMRSCEGLMRAAFRAMRIGVESPWPKFPDETVDDRTVRLHKWRNSLCFWAALGLSAVNFTVFLYWALRQVPPLVTFSRRTLSRMPAIAPSMRWCMGVLATLDRWWWVLVIVSAVVFGLWLWFKERVLKAVFSAVRNKWPSPGEVNKRGREPERPWSLFQLPDSLRELMLVRWIRSTAGLIWWVLAG
jgi:hypothetical protein